MFQFRNISIVLFTLLLSFSAATQKDTVLVLPEMSVKVLFLAQEDKQAKEDDQPVLTVSSSAVTQRNGSKVVFRIVDGQAEETKISTGRSFDGYEEILSGLNNGDKVIDNPGNDIEDGTSVAVK